MEEKQQVAILTMTDQETGEEIDFAIIDAVEYNKKRYILVIEEKELDNDEAEAFIFRVVEGNADSDEFYYEEITDPEEFDEVQTIFMEKENEDFEVTSNN